VDHLEQGGLVIARSARPLEPRQIVHRGVVEAAAILVDEDLAGPRGARRRVLAAWAPGATVHRLGGALLVRFASPHAWRPCCLRGRSASVPDFAEATSRPSASAPPSACRASDAAVSVRPTHRGLLCFGVIHFGGLGS
jgi:hypothetical protein